MNGFIKNLAREIFSIYFTRQNICMQDLLNPQVMQDLIDRITKLKSDSTAIWGRMNTAQMLSHVKVPVKLALGEATIKRNLIGLLLGGSAKKKLMSDQPFAHNLPTHPKFIRKGEYDFEKEKEDLLSILARLQSGGTSIITTDPHPFFGKMNSHEWSILLWKHFDHHLRQFGV